MANSKRRWMQFSLLTGFIVTTAVCVALGTWVVSAERQRRAVAAIEDLYGWVVYVERDETTERFPMTLLRRLLPRDYFDNVQQLYLTSSDVTDADLALLRALPRLRELYLDNTQITDAGLVRLQGLASLEILRLDDTQVSDAAVAKLRRALPSCHINGP